MNSLGTSPLLIASQPDRSHNTHPISLGLSVPCAMAEQLAAPGGGPPPATNHPIIPPPPPAAAPAGLARARSGSSGPGAVAGSAAYVPRRVLHQLVSDSLRAGGRGARAASAPGCHTQRLPRAGGRRGRQMGGCELKSLVRWRGSQPLMAAHRGVYVGMLLYLVAVF